MHFRIAYAALALVSSSAAISAPAQVLQPADNWDIDYGTTQCVAARAFKDAAAPIVLGIVPSFSGDIYKLLVSIPKVGPSFAKEARGFVDFGRGRIPSSALHYGRKDVKFSVYQFEVSAANMRRADHASFLDLRSIDGANFQFALSDLPALLDGLTKCSADLQRYWSAGGTRTPAQSRTGDIRFLFTSADYPSEALKHEELGSSLESGAQFQLLVDEKGSVEGCDVLTSSGDAALDATYCEVVGKRAKFTPARDFTGEPIRSVVTTPKISWNDENVLNSSCMWVTDTAFGVLDECGQREVRLPVRLPVAPPPPPPPPKISH